MTGQKLDTDEVRLKVEMGKQQFAGLERQDIAGACGEILDETLAMYDFHWSKYMADKPISLPAAPILVGLIW